MSSTQLAYIQHPVLATGTYHAAAITPDGVFSWGSTGNGRLGVGEPEEDTITKPTLVAFEEPLRCIWAGADHTGAIDDNGHLFLWGRGKYGQLGMNGRKDYWKPKKVSLPDVVTGTAGYGYTLVLKANGQVWGFGRNDVSQLGMDPENKVYKYPIAVPNLKHIVSIAAGYQHSLAVDEAGKVFAWGRNDSFQCGFDFEGLPGEVPGLDNIVQVSCGTSHSTALSADGVVYSWGDISLEDNSVEVSVVEGLGVSKFISSGAQFCAAVTEDGNVYYWGNSTEDEFSAQVPTQIEGLQNIRYISCGDDYLLAVDEENNVFGWGCSSTYQLGLGRGKTRLSAKQLKISVPDPVPAITRKKQVSEPEPEPEPEIDPFEGVDSIEAVVDALRHIYAKVNSIDNRLTNLERQFRRFKWEMS